MLKNFLLSLTLVISLANIASAAQPNTNFPVINQFEGYIINNQTAHQVAEKVITSVVNDAIAERERLITAHNNMAEKYKELAQSELDQRNIVAQTSYNWSNGNPYDFVSHGSHATHWLVVNGYTLTCQHRTIEGTQTHAQTFIEVQRSLNELLQNKEYVDKIAKDPGILSAEYCLKRLPEALAPFMEQKKAELSAEIKKKELNLQELNCKVVIGRTNNPMGFIPFVAAEKNVTCKTAKKCKLVIIVDTKGVLQIGCACEHDMSEHTFKYKEKSSAE